MIEFNRVTFIFDNNTPFKNMIFNNASVTIGKNKMNLFFGYSGDGKTTFVKLLTRIFVPNGGEIIIDNVPLKKYRRDDLARKIISLPQSIYNFFSYDTIIKELDYRYETIYGKMADENILMYLFEYFGLKFKIHDSIDDLSNGEKKIISIIMVLILNPEYLILDEPFVGLDDYRAERLVYYLKYEFAGKVIIISHNVTQCYLAIDSAFLVNGYTIQQIDLLYAFEQKILTTPVNVKIAKKLGMNPLSAPSSISERLKRNEN